jgi:hypothetical protein
MLSCKYITKPWREIVDPAGATISQIKRCTHMNFDFNHLELIFIN